MFDEILTSIFEPHDFSYNLNLEAQGSQGNLEAALSLQIGARGPEGSYYVVINWAVKNTK